MPNPDKPAVFSLLNSAESIYSIRTKFRFVLIWAMFASAWIIMVSVFFVVFTFGPKTFDNLELLILAISVVFIGIPLFVAAIFVLPFSWKGASKIEDFMAVFHPIWIKMQVEAEGIRQNDINNTILRIVRKISPGYKRIKTSKRIYKKVVGTLSSFDIILNKGRKLGLVRVIEPGESLGKDEVLFLEKTAYKLAKTIRRRIRFFLLVQDNNNFNFNNWEDEDILVGKNTIVIFLSRAERGLNVNWVSPIKR